MDGLLRMFPSVSEASRVAGLSRTAAHHWYASGDTRCLPSARSVMQMADSQGLTDLQLGEVVRDMERVRDGMHVSRNRRKAARVREANKRRDREKLAGRNESARKREAAYDSERLARQEREEEIRKKEEFLAGEVGEEGLDRLIEILERSD